MALTPELVGKDRRRGCRWGGGMDGTRLDQRRGLGGHRKQRGSRTVATSVAWVMNSRECVCEEQGMKNVSRRKEADRRVDGLRARYQGPSQLCSFAALHQGLHYGRVAPLQDCWLAVWKRDWLLGFHFPSPGAASCSSGAKAQTSRPMTSSSLVLR
jgi:hypothetical protein